MKDTIPVLSVARLQAGYGRSLAVHDVSFEVRRGECICFVGPNGAGKSTVFKLLSGGLRLRSGSIRLKGTDTLALTPDQIARLGVSLVPEGRRIFGSLTVQENLLLGTYIKPRDTSTELARVYEYFPRLAERKRQPGGKLSGGEQQMLAIGRALLTGADTILIDEPSLGLAPQYVDQVYNILGKLQVEQNLTLLINEQGFERALRVGNVVHMLRDGHIVLSINRGDPVDDETMRRAYFGHDSGGRQ